VLVTIVDPDSGAGYDYTGLAAWELDWGGDPNSGNLVTSAEGVQAQCRASSGTLDGTKCLLAGWVTSATYRPEIINHASEYHDGIWSSSIYRINDSWESTSIEATYSGGCDDLLVRGIQVGSSSSAAAYSLSLNNPDGDTIVERCIVKNETASPTGYGIIVNYGGAGRVSNCLVYDHGSGFYGTGGSTYFNNCTAANCVTGYKFDADPIFKNCLAADNTTDFGSGSYHASCTNNCSEDASAPGSSARTSGTVTFEDAASDDYHLSASDTHAKGYGVDLSGDTYPVTVDIDNVTRGSTWDIGADQVSVDAAGGARNMMVI